MKRILLVALLTASVVAPCLGSQDELVVRRRVAAAAPAGLAFDNASSDDEAGITQITVSHTAGSLTNGCAFMCVSWYGGGGITISSVTYDGNAATLVGGSSGDSNNKSAIYRFLGPDAGASNAVVNFSGTTDAVLGVMTFSGVHQTTPTGTPATAEQTGTSISVNVGSTTTADIVIDVMSHYGNAGEAISATTTQAGQTERWDHSNAGQAQGGQGSTRAGQATSTDMGWTLAFDAPEDTTITAVAIKPA